MPSARRTPREEARELIDYDRAVFELYVRRLSRLPWRVVSRPREIGHHSLFRTLVHILNVHEVWHVYIVRGRQKELDALFRDRSRHPTDWPGLRAYSARVWSGVGQTLTSLTDRDFARVVKAPWMPGRYTVRDAFFQSTFEEAHHIGEIVGALWQDDREPPMMMWIPTRSRLTTRPRRPRARRRG